MKKYVIFGVNGMAKDLCNFVESDGHEMAAYVLDRKYIKETVFYGKDVIPYEELEEHFQKDELTILVMIGYSHMNDVRKTILERCKTDGWDVSSFIHSSVSYTSKSIGYGNIIASFVKIGADVVIGNGNIISSDTMIGHDSIIGNYNFFSGRVYFGGHVRIGNHNFLGSNSIIENEILIDDYDIVGAGVCLSKNLESYMIAAPQPIRRRRLSVENMDVLLLKNV